jgi:hypothetical protein
MNPTTKKSLLDLVDGVHELVVQFIADLPDTVTGPIEGDGPGTPDPMPSPDPTPQPPPVHPTCSACRNETLMLIVSPQDAVGIELPTDCTVEFFRPGSYDTQGKPSYKGAPAGPKFIDPLVPIPAEQAALTASVFVDLKVGKNAVPGDYIIRILGEPISLRIWKMEMGDQPLPPMFTEIQSRACLLAHGLPDNVSAQGPITQKYINLLRAHRIEPIKQNILLYPTVSNGKLLLDQWKEYGASFRQLVLEGRIAAPCVFGPAPNIPPSIELLKAIEAAIKAGELPFGTYCYAWDEGEGDAAATAAALTRCKLIRQYAPSLTILVTRRRSAEFEPYVDIFVSAAELTDAYQPDYMVRPSDGMYGSCMAQGSCTTGVLGTPTGSPMMLIDAPDVHRRAYIPMAMRFSKGIGLYYNATESLGTAWTNQLKFQGHGDGNLLYPGRKGAGFADDVPVPSLRLKDVRWGSYFAELCEMTATERQRNVVELQLAALMKSPTSFSQDSAAWEGARTLIGDMLNAEFGV